jgi:kynurenine formamidase
VERHTAAGEFMRRDACGLGPPRQQGRGRRVPFPGLQGEATEWQFRRRNVAGLAADTMSLDHGPSKDFKTIGCGCRRVVGGSRTWTLGLAKVKDATGGPARLIALV